jgi:hypothetical protein
MEMISFTLVRIDRGERAPGTHWTGGSEGPRAGLYAMERKTLFSYLESNPSPLVVHPVA